MSKSIKKYKLTMRSRVTAGTDVTEIDVHPGQNSDEVAARVASSYGADVVSVEPLKPLTTRQALRECLGFVEAWQSHLDDQGNTKAAVTVARTLERARAAYAVTPNIVRTESVQELIAANGDDIWAVHPQFPIGDWMCEVEDGDTRLGYWEWVLSKLDAGEVGGN